MSLPRFGLGSHLTQALTIGKNTLLVCNAAMLASACSKICDAAPSTNPVGTFVSMANLNDKCMVPITVSDAPAPFVQQLDGVDVDVFGGLT